MASGVRAGHRESFVLLLRIGGAWNGRIKQRLLGL